MPTPKWSVSMPVLRDPFIYFLAIQSDNCSVCTAYPRSKIKLIKDYPASGCVMVFLNDGTSIATKELFDDILRRLND
ncbi:MAG: hypothetical protein A2104_00865 [Candidatus Melainabacteria bacterium GWF2_32_7]|nr:MAG: hypothetical protein A2104_00865 [Candidatus Melainabacteria bacterium GWF2_32_7]